MSALKALCQATLLICLISSITGCAIFEKPDSGFQWLDVNAVPMANTDFVFDANATFGDLAAAYINLKHECRATNYGVDELRKASDELKRLK